MVVIIWIISNKAYSISLTRGLHIVIAHFPASLLVYVHNSIAVFVLFAAMVLLLRSPAYVGVNLPMLCVLPPFTGEILVEWMRWKKNNDKYQTIWVFSYDKRSKKVYLDRGRRLHFYSDKTDHDLYHKLVLVKPQLGDAGKYWCKALIGAQEHFSKKKNLEVVGK